MPFIIPNSEDILPETKFREQKIHEDKLPKIQTNQRIQICPSIKSQKKHFLTSDFSS
jgi:hypothetical protein